MRAIERIGLRVRRSRSVGDLLMDTERRGRLFRQRVERWGRIIHFYLPGMITLDGKRGLYPAVSITGSECRLGCIHCRGNLLKDMNAARSSEELKTRGLQLFEAGAKGILVSGGCDERGRIPFERMIEAIAFLKRETGMHISVHTGMKIEKETAKRLQWAGVDQALIDVIADGETLRRVCRLEDPGVITRSIEAITGSGMELVPHVVIGIDDGKVKGEYRALDLIRTTAPRMISLVVFMPSVARKDLAPPPLEDVVEVLLHARETLPDTRVSLGCARPRGEYRYLLEEIAIESGVTALAVWSDRAATKARSLSLDVHFHYTCCSVPPEF